MYFPWVTRTALPVVTEAAPQKSSRAVTAEYGTRCTTPASLPVCDRQTRPSPWRLASGTASALSTPINGLIIVNEQGLRQHVQLFLIDLGMRRAEVCLLQCR